MCEGCNERREIGREGNVFFAKVTRTKEMKVHIYIYRDVKRVLYECKCKLYHQHLGYGADAEDIHGDTDFHRGTCNQQNHPALVALDYPPLSNHNRVQYLSCTTKRLIKIKQ